MSDCEDKSKCITDGELTLCGCFMVKQDELESQATRIAELESDIKEAMDAGYAQGVLATEGKAIARISELEQENASYFKQAQFYLVEKERAEAQVEKFHQGFILQQAEAERLAGEVGRLKLVRENFKDIKKMEAEVERFKQNLADSHWGNTLLRARTEKAEADLKEQTRLGLACHDELAELKAKIRKMVAKW